MVKPGGHLWARHPAVRSGSALTLGERAADGLKAIFGTWTLLFAIIIGIILWITLVTDPGELRLNLGLSFLASVQGVILQIAANRGDRIAGEVALHTEGNTDALKQQGEELLTLQKQQMTMLAELAAIRQAVTPSPEGDSK
jgi:uncharacterized membrane protein